MSRNKTHITLAAGRARGYRALLLNELYRHFGRKRCKCLRCGKIGTPKMWTLPSGVEIMLHVHAAANRTSVGNKTVEIVDYCVISNSLRKKSASGLSQLL